MQTLMQKLFPTGSVRSDGKEVNGLAKGSLPINCKILEQAPSIFPVKNDRRDLFIVEADGRLILFRICTAYPDSGYDEYAVVHYVADKENRADVEYLYDFFLRQTKN